MTHEETVITLQLNDDQALALTQFVKRLTWTDLRGKAANTEEAYTMMNAIDVLRQALQDAGYAPR